MRGVLPLVASDPPFGVLYGMLAQAVLPPEVAMGMSFIVFAGSAQMISVQLFAGATPGVIIILATLVVNLRHLLYGASMAPYLKHLPARWKWLLAYLLTDEAYALAIMRYNRPDIQKQGATGTNAHWYTFGAGLGLWASWQVATAVGVYFMSQVSIPPEWGLDFAFPLTFIALLVPTLSDRAGWIAALAAGVIGLVLAGMPLKLGLIAAALIGIVAGVAAERWLTQRQSVTAPAVHEPSAGVE